MNSYIVPTNLKKALIEVKIEHPIRGSEYTLDSDNDELYQLVNRVCKWNASNVLKSSELLEEYEISSLAKYVVKNKYKVKCDNIYAVLSIRANQNDMFNIFFDWQNCIGNKEAKNFIHQQLNMESTMKSMILDKGIELTKILPWISNNDLLNAILKQVGPCDSHSSFKNKLNSCGVVENSYLYDECLSMFYLTCSAKAYKEADENELANAYRNYVFENKLIMIVNFLKRMSLSDIQDYSVLHEAVKNSINQNAVKEKFYSKLKEFNVYDKYNMWSNAVEVAILLYGDPMRIEFWRPYAIVGNFENYEESFSISFPNVVITEFVNKAGGPSYLYDKTFYERNVKRKQKYEKNAVFRSYEFELFNQKSSGLIGGRRYVHDAGDNWIYNLRYDLKKLGVVPYTNK